MLWNERLFVFAALPGHAPGFSYQYNGVFLTVNGVFLTVYNNICISYAMYILCGRDIIQYTDSYPIDNVK